VPGNSCFRPYGFIAPNQRDSRYITDIITSIMREFGSSNASWALMTVQVDSHRSGVFHLVWLVLLFFLAPNAVGQTTYPVPVSVITPDSASTNLVSQVLDQIDTGVGWTHDGVVAREGAGHNGGTVLVRDGLAAEDISNGGRQFPGRTITYSFDEALNGIGGFVLWNNAGGSWLDGYLKAATVTFHSETAGGGSILHEALFSFTNGSVEAIPLPPAGDPNNGVNVAGLDVPLDGVRSVVFSELEVGNVPKYEVAFGEFGLFRASDPPVFGTSTVEIGEEMKIDFNSDPGTVEPGYLPYTSAHESPEVERTETYPAFGTSVSLTVDYPDTTDLRVRQSLDRGSDFDANYDGLNLDLVTDFIGIDCRSENGGNGAGQPTTMLFRLNGLPAGRYRYRGYHHDTEYVNAPFQIAVLDANGLRDLGAYEMTGSTSFASNPTPVNPGAGNPPSVLDSTVEFEFVSDGVGEIVVNYMGTEGANVHESIVGVNGIEIGEVFELASLHAPRWINGVVDYGFDFNDPAQLGNIGAGEYGYCRRGIPMSTNFPLGGIQRFPYSSLTGLSAPSLLIRDDLFLVGIQGDLNQMGVRLPLAGRDWSEEGAVYTSWLSLEVPPHHGGALMRYLHFRPTLAESFSGLGETADFSRTFDSNTEKAVILIHGWNPESRPYHYLGYFSKLGANLRKSLEGTDWVDARYHWEADADTGAGGAHAAIDGTRAAEVARMHGWHLGELLVDESPNLRKIHLIAHSAGSWAARECARYLNQVSPHAFVQITLLDPFMPNTIPLVSSNLGKNEMNRIRSPDSDFPEHERIWKLENYYSGHPESQDEGEELELFDRLGLLLEGEFVLGTEGAFSNWEAFDLPDVRVDEGDTEDRYIGHDGPILFYADSVDKYAGNYHYVPETDHEHELLGGLYGWDVSMFMVEPRILVRVAGGQRFEDGQTIRLAEGSDRTFASYATNRRLLTLNPIEPIPIESNSVKWYKDGVEIWEEPDLSLRMISLSHAGDYEVVYQANIRGVTDEVRLKFTIEVAPEWGDENDNGIPDLITGPEYTYQAQIRNYFQNEANTIAFIDDYDGDGMSNGIEHAMGVSPSHSNSSPVIASVVETNVSPDIDEPSEHFLSLEVPVVSAALESIEVTAECASSLGGASWIPVQRPPVVVNRDGDVVKLRFIDDAPFSAGTRRYMRLRFSTLAP